MPTPTPCSFPVADGGLAALRWGDGPRVVVTTHGITANAMSWRAVARHLLSIDPGWSLVSLDLRGRGRSRDLPPSYDGETLARDVRDVAAHLDAEVIAGHSLGAYVAMGVEHLFPGTVSRLVLVDGGIPLPVPEGIDVDVILEAVVGPMVERLDTTFADEEAYVDFFRAHPAMGPSWSEDFDAYARYDARRTPEGVRAAAREGAVRSSGRDLLTRGAEIRAAVEDLSVPAHLLFGTRGMQDEPSPFLPAPSISEAVALSGHLTVEEVPDTNHYTILFGGGAARVAEVISGDSAAE